MGNRSPLELALRNAHVLLLPLVYLIAKKWRSPLPLTFLWIAAIIAGWGSHYAERLGFPDLFIFAPCFMAGALAYKASSLPRLNLPTALWPVALAFITLFYLRHDTLARSWWSCLALGLLLPQFREISTPVFRGSSNMLPGTLTASISLISFSSGWLSTNSITIPSGCAGSSSFSPRSLHLLSSIIMWKSP